MTGLKTLSSRWPLLPATEIAVWFPITCAQTIVKASDWVGFTLPGMIEEPGSLSGRRISPIAQRGPDASNRKSFAIFMSEQASVFRWPDVSTIASWAAMASNLFSAVVNGMPVMRETCLANSSAKPCWEFSPVPTAVPPCASWDRRGRPDVTRAMPYLIWVA